MALLPFRYYLQHLWLWLSYWLLYFIVLSLWLFFLATWELHLLNLLSLVSLLVSGITNLCLDYIEELLSYLLQ